MAEKKQEGIDTGEQLAADDAPGALTNRALQLFLVAVIGLAVVGFFVGIWQGTPVYEPPEREVVDRPRDPDAVPAMGYVEFDRRLHGPNRDWRSTLEDLDQPERDLFDEPERTDEGRQAVLAARAGRRAFMGAPPVVPHPVDQMGTASCMACHEHGLRIGTVVASKMSHEYLPNCTQCHVEQRSPDFRDQVPAENYFDGITERLGGDRAWPGAPPTIPHTTHMRENCMACHGPAGPDPIRTTHPWQTNCMQCHVPSAELDQVVEPEVPPGGILSALDPMQ